MIAGRNRTREVKLQREPVGKKQEKLPWPRMADDGVTPLGVDVAAKRKDIVKIVHKYFKVSEVSMEELLQEVFLAIVHKNRGRSAHDPRKSSFGHYVFMVANNVCINLVHRRRRFAMERDSLDAPCGHDEKRTLMDTIEVEEDVPQDPIQDRMEEFESEMRKRGMWDLARYVRAARSGASPEVIREALSFGNRTVTTKTVRDLRLQAREFAESVAGV